LTGLPYPAPDVTEITRKLLVNYIKITI